MKQQDRAKTVKAADYYEALLRARVVKAMKALRASVSAGSIASAVASKQRAKKILPEKAFESSLSGATKVIRDAFAHGGKLAAEQVPHG